MPKNSIHIDRILYNVYSIFIVMFENVPRNIFLGKYLLTVKPPCFEEDFEMLEYILYCCLSNDSTQDIFMKTSEYRYTQLDIHIQDNVK